MMKAFNDIVPFYSVNTFALSQVCRYLRTSYAGDLGSIPGSGRSPGEGIVYPLQYSRYSLVAQTVKNLPEMCETWVQSLSWEDPLEEGMAIDASILA